MIDMEGRARARQIIKKIMSDGLHPDDIEVYWPRSEDAAVRSIQYWLWTLFDDDSEKSVLLERPDQRQVLENAEAFLGTSLPLQPISAGLRARLKHFLEAGVEWRGCELPWHPDWPFSPGTNAGRSKDRFSAK